MKEPRSAFTPRAILPLLACLLLLGSADAELAWAEQTVIPFDQFLKFQDHMEADTKSYEGFIERFSIIGGGAAALFVTGFGAILAWMNYKTKSDVEEAVRRQLEAIVVKKIETAVADKMMTLSPLVEQVVNKHAAEAKDKMDGLREEIERNARLSKERMEQIVSDFQAKMVFVNKTLYEQTGSQIAQNSDSPPQPGSQERMGADQVSGLRILWVDDFPSNNTGPASALESLGAQITYSLSTEDALAKIAGSPQGFDFILSDMGRGTDYHAGVDLVEALRADGNQVPVIIYCSSRGAREFGEAAKKAGAYAIVSGPTRLLATIKALLSGQPKYARFNAL